MKSIANLSRASCVGMRRRTWAASKELRAKLSVLPARDLVIVDLVLIQRNNTIKLDEFVWLSKIYSANLSGFCSNIHNTHSMNITKLTPFTMTINAISMLYVCFLQAKLQNHTHMITKLKLTSFFYLKNYSCHFQAMMTDIVACFRLKWDGRQTVS